MSLKKDNLLRFGAYTIDLTDRILWRDEELVPLAPKVLETLCVLVENHGRLMLKEELFDRIWGDTFVEERNLTQNIFTLRKVLGEGSGGIKFIETIPRRGYRFVAEVRDEKGSDPENVVVEPEETQLPPRQEPRVESPSRRAAAYALAFTALIIGGAILWGWKTSLFGEWGGSPEPLGPSGALAFERLTDSGKVFFPTISPNKQFFAYVLIDKGAHSIELQNFATGSRTVVVEPGELEISRPKFSADGNYLLFRQEEAPGKPGIIYQVPILGGTPRQVATRVSSDFSVSPDGQWLAFFRNISESEGQTLIVCRTSDGGGERVLASRTGNESFAIWGQSPSWSPDGKHVLARLIAEPTLDNPSVESDVLGLVSTDDGSFHPVMMPKWNNFIQAEWTPDGKSILFLAQERPNNPFQIWQVSFPSGDGRRITNDLHDYHYLSVATDGEFILSTLERNFSNLWTIPINDPSRPTQLTFSSELRHGDRGISWTPDGNGLVFTLLENFVDGNIWTINIQTQEKRQLTYDHGAVNWYPTVTPDNKSVIFSSNRVGGTHVWQMDINGKNLRRITDGPGESFSNISADGKWLIYASPAWVPETLWKRPIDVQEAPSKFSVRAAGSNSVSPDGKHLVISYKDEDESGKLVYRYGLMPFERDEAPADLGFHPHFGAIAWKPDSSGFFYIKQLGKNLTSIWLYDLRAKTHRQVADFNDRMRSLSLSPDGNTLATARGETISNIFRITGL